MLARLAIAVLALCALHGADAVDRSKFRTCASTGFCHTHRPKGTPVDLAHMFQVQPATAKEESGHFSAAIVAPNNPNPLTLDLFFLKNGAVRLKISEQAERWQPTDLLLPHGLEVAAYRRATAGELPSDWKGADPSTFAAFAFETRASSAHLNLDTTGDQDRNVLVVQYSPLKVAVYRDDIPTIVFNDRQLMHFEQTGGAAAIAQAEEVPSEDRHHGKEVVDYGEDGLALYADGTREERTATPTAAPTAASTGETFNGHHDTMPHGPRSIGFDISFPAAQHVYGIPEHTTPLSLPDSRGDIGQGKYDEPYRLYNLDVFEYEIDNTMALYGHIPLMFGHGMKGARPVSAGVFLFNPSELFVDISTSEAQRQTHWMAESGLIDLFLLPGSQIKATMHQYMALTGGQALPPLFSLGYHQCRWNYRDEKDVAAVNGMFEKLNYPYDVIWLDIEHTDGKRYFTWDKSVFPQPLEMQQNLTALGRKMVTIIDPHLKRDSGYHVHAQALAQDLYVKDKHRSVFDGWCWPGSSSYLDFTNAKVRAFWASQFNLNAYAGSTLDLYTWNDMNEPSVFNGPEVSMPKDNLNLDGVEHREWHNLYGIYMQMATAQGQVERSISAIADAGASLLDKALSYLPLTSKKEADNSVVTNDKKLRPFVLTRAFWAGSQRYGAMWTGDNTADWEHLRISLPMLMSINIAGLSFAGSDVGGFFRDTDPELFVRWYQAGSFTPFFRGHAHLETQRKEPWVYGEPFTSLNRAAALLRYTMLPYWYTVMQQANELGLPAMRPYFVEYPHLPTVADVDDAHFVGDSVLFHPVTAPKATEVVVKFPADRGAWYELQTLKRVAGSAVKTGFAEVRYPVDLATIPAFVRPGSIFARKMRLRRSSKLMHYDPLTLFVAPTDQSTAQGSLYMDDESTFGYEDGHFVHRAFSFANNKLTCASLKSTLQPVGYGVTIAQKDEYVPTNTVERVVIGGQSRAPSRVVLKGGAEGEKTLSFTLDGEVLTIKKPDALVAQDWEIELQF